MPDFEARWPCPVCLGATMEKVPVSDALILDVCPRCNGVWFDAGEVQQLARCKPAEFWALIGRRDEVARVPCHFCQAIVPRDQDRCPACGKEQAFGCPRCEEPMRKVKSDDIVLDVCERCRGVWFDNQELTTIWDHHGAARGWKPPQVDVGAVGANLLDVAAYDPFLAIDAVELAGRAATAGAEVVADAVPGLLAGLANLLSDAPEALAGVADGLGDLASAAFDAIVEIISGLTR